MLRRTLIRSVWPAGIMIAIGSRMAAAQVVIDNFTFSPTPVKVTAGTIVTWVNHDDIPHSIVLPVPKDAFERIGYRW
jgi:plastocyanin